jgi:hypothetical protein
LNTAEGHPTLNERLWAKLRASFDGLDQTLQQMFLDAATFSYGSLVREWRFLTLRDAKVAWRAAYGCQASVLWKRLVDLSVVYEIGEKHKFRMHEQLRELAKKIASEPNYGRRMVGCDTEWLLLNLKELDNKV